MKKIYQTMLLCALLSVLLCVGAMAEDVNGAGFYDIGSAVNVTVTPEAVGTNEVALCAADVDEAGDYEHLYLNSEKLSVSITGLDNSKQYLVLLVKGDGTSIKESDICYIDQSAPADGELTFNVYPLLPTATTDMTLLINGSDGSSKTVSLGYAVAGWYAKRPYLLGDADGDESISVNDALFTLQAVAQSRELNGNDALAADADEDDSISVNDALFILQAVANSRTLV